MTNLELLYDKLSSEYDKFIAGLLASPRAEIMDSAYEKIIKDDILSCMEYASSLSAQEISALLSLENPLDELYLNWRDTDDSHMDELRESIDRFAKHEADRRTPENPQTVPTVNGVIQPSDEDMSTVNAERQAMLYPEKRSALMACINDNLRDYHSALMDFGKRELIEMAEKISAMSNAHSYMMEYDFADDELDFLLHVQNPLEVVADASLDYRGAMTDDIGFALGHVFTHKQDFIVNYSLTKDADISSDTGLRRFMGVDLISFLGNIVNNVITDYRSEWHLDRDVLSVAAGKSEFNDRRFIWAVCPNAGTLLNYEKDVFIEGSDAYKAMTKIHQREIDIFGYYVEVIKDDGRHVIGNVYEVGNYADFVKHILDTALPAESVTLSYSGEWGANAGKTITVSTYEYDRDRYRLMYDTGNVISVCYNPTDGHYKLRNILSAEHARRMSYPIGSIEAFHQNLLIQTKAIYRTTKKQSIVVRLEEAHKQARAYNAQHTDISKQHKNRTDKEMI